MEAKLPPPPIIRQLPALTKWCGQPLGLFAFSLSLGAGKRVHHLCARVHGFILLKRKLVDPILVMHMDKTVQEPEACALPCFDSSF